MARLRFALLVLAAALLAGCGSSRHAGPSQGLVVQTKKAVLLVGLDGRVLRTLPGYTMGVGSRDLALDAVVQSDDAVPVLLGPGGRVWEVANGTIVPVPPLTIPLPGGTEIAGRVVKRRSDGSPITAVVVKDTKTGKPLAAGAISSWFVTANGLLVTPKVVTDLATRRRWLLRGADWAQGVGTSFCDPAGVRGDRVIASCYFENVVRIFSVAHDGSREILGKPFPYAEFGALAAFLSPDGKHVAATLAVGCGLTPSTIAPTDGGAARYIDGSSRAGARAQSWILGWTAAGKVVAEFQHGECTKVSPPAIYLVDPGTFKRTQIYVLPKSATAYTMWSSGA
jgi:hypothetical protein